MEATALFLTFTGTLFLLWLTWWASVKEKRYHGISRFFAFESILLLAIENYSVWFTNPFSLHQIISWVSLLLSAIIALNGFLLLKYPGKPIGKFENTTNLITSGIFRYIRHPLYLSLFLLALGSCLKKPGLYQLILLTVNIISVYITARIEENEMKVRFGLEYDLYMNQTKMFVPFLF